MQQVKSNENQVRAKVLLDGRVQNVGLRYHTQEQATGLGLTGFIRNLTDGRVEVVFEGPADKVEELLDWFQEGSLQARIDTIALRYEEPEGRFADFSVKV
ncbi:MAG: acylphosphatase [Chloroflexota bacterium]